ncbi:MAG: DUF3047 domain-containing protein [Rhodospirillaceae bacterium]|nr:DUF3047 domain-containing protein [Rhodospirillaceae bacterium]
MVGEFHSTLSKLKMSLIGGLGAILIAGPAVALDLNFTPDLKSAGWRMHVPRGKQAAEFLIESTGSLTVQADSQVAFLYTFVPDDPLPGHTLRWSWRVDKDFPGTNLSDQGSDDRPLAVHVYFADQDAGLLKKMGRGMAAMFGVPVSGEAITYVWGGQRPVGTMIPNPFMDDGEGVLFIRQSPGFTATGQWVDETVDLAADYRAAFGGELSAVSVIAVSADTDDTGAQSQAQIRDLQLADSLIEPR